MSEIVVIMDDKHYFFKENMRLVKHGKQEFFSEIHDIQSIH